MPDGPGTVDGEGLSGFLCLNTVPYALDRLVVGHAFGKGKGLFHACHALQQRVRGMFDVCVSGGGSGSQCLYGRCG